MSSDVRFSVIKALRQFFFQMCISSCSSQILRLYPTTLKPFAPQLQRTFSKALEDNNDRVRRASIEAIKMLIPLLPRLDPLITELLNQTKTEDREKIMTYKEAISAVLEVGRDRIGEQLADKAQVVMDT